jgi:hypothetical protein
VTSPRGCLEPSSLAVPSVLHNWIVNKLCWICLQRFQATLKPVHNSHVADSTPCSLSSLIFELWIIFNFNILNSLTKYTTYSWLHLLVAREHCPLECFRGGINYRCLLGLCTVQLYVSEWLSNSDSTVTQLWNLITLRDPEEVHDTISETSVGYRATQYKVPEGTYNLPTVYRFCWTTDLPFAFPPFHNDTWRGICGVIRCV